MNQKNVLKLVITVAVSELAGGVGAIFTIDAISSWYAFLAKPPLVPPSWVFGPVWTTLYFLMGIAAFLVWRTGWRRTTKIALGIFAAQLVLNALWSIIFFGLHQPGLAFIVLVALWIMILWIILAFRKISKTAAWLLVPYLAWTTFAAYLNLGIWMLNR